MTYYQYRFSSTSIWTLCNYGAVQLGILKISLQLPVRVRSAYVIIYFFRFVKFLLDSKKNLANGEKNSNSVCSLDGNGTQGPATPSPRANNFPLARPPSDRMLLLFTGPIKQGRAKFGSKSTQLIVILNNLPLSQSFI